MDEYEICFSRVGIMSKEKWIKRKGLLTKLFKSAGISTKGGVVKRMTEANCHKLGRWMAKHKDQWCTKKRCDLVGRMMIQVLGRPKTVSEKKRRKINKCGAIVSKYISGAIS